MAAEEPCEDYQPSSRFDQISDLSGLIDDWPENYFVGYLSWILRAVDVYNFCGDETETEFNHRLNP